MRKMISVIVVAAMVWMYGAGEAAAQVNGNVAWGAVERLKKGTRIEVEAGGQPGASVYYDHCRVVSVDAQDLTCKSSVDGRRMVYAMGQVDSVYRVKNDVWHDWVPAAFAVALGGVCLGGILALNAAAFAVCLVGGLVALVASGVSSDMRAFDAAWGNPAPAPPVRERLEAVYRRGGGTRGVPGASTSQGSGGTGNGARDRLERVGGDWDFAAGDASER